MTYNNTENISGFSIVSQPAGFSPQQPQQQQEQQHLAKCVTEVYSASDGMIRSCYTATVARLRRNQPVFIRNNDKFHRPVVTSAESSFWGIYTIA